MKRLLHTNTVCLYKERSVYSIGQCHCLLVFVYPFLNTKTISKAGKMKTSVKHAIVVTDMFRHSNTPISQSIIDSHTCIWFCCSQLTLAEMTDTSHTRGKSLLLTTLYKGCPFKKRKQSWLKYNRADEHRSLEHLLQHSSLRDLNYIYTRPKNNTVWHSTSQGTASLALHPWQKSSETEFQKQSSSWTLSGLQWNVSSEQPLNQLCFSI